MRKKKGIQKGSADIEVLGKTRALKNHNDGFCILWSIIYKLPVLHITAKNNVSLIWWIFYLQCSLWFLFTSASSTVKIKFGKTLSIATTGNTWDAMFWLKDNSTWQHMENLQNCSLKLKSFSRNIFNISLTTFSHSNGRFIFYSLQARTVYSLFFIHFNFCTVWNDIFFQM